MFIAVFTNTMATVDIEDNDDQGMSKIYHDLMAELSEIKSQLNEIQVERSRAIIFFPAIRMSYHIHPLLIFPQHCYLSQQKSPYLSLEQMCLHL